MAHKLMTYCAVVAILLIASTATQAVDISYWRFEDGPAETDVPHGAASGVYAPDVPDASGNGNELSMWTTGGCCGYRFESDVPASTVPQTGAANNFSVQNTGGYPSTFTDAAGPMNGLELSQWTIEASWKPENGGYRTVVGRDARGVASSNGNLAALYLQAQPDSSLAIKFTDEAGYFHEAISAPGIVTGFDFGSDPNGLTGVWHNIAATSDGSTLSLYLNKGTGYSLVAQTDLTASGSPDTRMTDGFNTVGGSAGGGDWTAGDWSVGRGLYAGGHGDRAYGFVDEVRISDAALAPTKFLGTHPATLAYWRFEGGPDGSPVPHGTTDGYPNYAPDVPDASGSSNHLSMWSTGGGPGFQYRSDVPGPTVLQTGGTPNNFSMKNTGPYPASFTQPGSLMSTLELSEWTVEASWKPENGGYRTVVGRDARGVASSNGDLAALYLGAVPGDALAIKFTDEDGFFHEAISAPGVVTGFDFGSDPDGLTGVWHNIAATSDGSTLSLYLDTGAGYSLVAQTDLTASGSTNTALTDGFNAVGGVAGGGDWGAGDWSVGRGLYAGGHTDRAWGFIDEVRISHVALSPRLFLHTIPEPATWLLAALAGLGLALGRRRRRETS